MKQQWEKFALRIDALSLRERVIVFAAAILILILLVNSFLLDPQYARQAALSQQIRQQQSQIADIQNQIQQTVKARETDPDQADRAHLRQLQEEAGRMHAALSDLQKRLVPPHEMADLLEEVLKRNNKLLLVSLKTLPVTSLTDIAQSAQSSADKAAAPQVVPQAEDASGIETVYKHTVQLTVQGSYMDMLAYMRALEALPWELFWGSAQLAVDDYPKATLTLTLFTLSQDKKWLDL
jgi:MSHA biogenesis protein MshJ